MEDRMEEAREEGRGERWKGGRRGEIKGKEGMEHWSKEGKKKNGPGPVMVSNILALLYTCPFQ